MSSSSSNLLSPSWNSTALKGCSASRNPIPTFIDTLATLTRQSYPIPGLDEKVAFTVFAKANEYFHHLTKNEDLSNLCQLVTSIVHYHQVSLPSDLHAGLLANLIKRLKEASSHIHAGLNATPPAEPRALFLKDHYHWIRALGALIYNVPASKVSKYYEDLLGPPRGILLVFTHSLNPIVDCIRAAVSCLGNLCSLTTTGPADKSDSDLGPYLAPMRGVVSRFLQAPPNETHAATFSKNVVASLAALNSILLKNAQLEDSEMPRILALLKVYIFHGLKLDMPSTSLPSYDPLNSSLNESKTGKRLIKENDFMFTSDSEFSDSETSSSRKIMSADAKVRTHALQCVQLVVKQAPKKLVQGYWQSFIPDSSSPGIPSLLSLIRADPSPKARNAGLVLLALLFEGSKPFLTAASDLGGVGAFTSHAAVLGGMVVQVHDALIASLTMPPGPTTLQALKGLGVVMGNTTYERLKSRFAPQIATVLAPLCACPDGVIANEALTTCSIFFAAKFAEKDFSSLLSGPFPPFEDLKAGKCSLSCVNSTDLVPGIMSYCFAKSPSLRTASLQCISSLVASHAALLPHAVSCSLVPNIAFDAILDRDSSVRLQAAKLLEELGKAIKAKTIREGRKFWSEVMRGKFLFALTQDSSPHVRASAFDILSTLCADSLLALEKGSDSLVVSLVLGYLKDDSQIVRAAVMRSMGVFVSILPLSADVSFLEEAAGALVEAISDPSVNVRIKVSWALGNLCDTLCRNKKQLLGLEDTDEEEGARPHKEQGKQEGEVRGSEDELEEHLSPMVVPSIVSAALIAAKDNDKVKISAIRSLGNIASVLSHEAEERERVADVVAALLLTLKSNTAKVKWNACYALGNVLRHCCVLSQPPPSWLPQVLEALSSVVPKSNNFKIKINAVHALSLLPSRLFYGPPETLIRIYSVMLETLVAIDTLGDFSEFKYRDSLLNQLCGGIVHMTDILGAAGELALVEPMVLAHAEGVLQHFDKWATRQLKSLESSDPCNAELSSSSALSHPSTNPSKDLVVQANDVEDGGTAEPMHLRVSAESIQRVLGILHDHARSKLN